ncbi:IS30 family transposase [Porphyromonas circumdentaria]|uniref:IS30 family transposase n=1 Tax=Porphyromonas circumdentaria TaxID=29524 RepID=UPI0026DAF0C1|nr:IS30 family transposase [Porphyromonas circumdentaria]MDO4722685.1 IS30 family transposase [Porphyromonas circumdentaria]
MKKYNHLSREQRYTIDRLLQQKKSYSFIAQTIGVSTSTVSREVKRNKTARGRYSCHAAHMYATERKEWRCYPRKFTDKMQEQVVQILREKQWSPEQIVGRFRLKGIPIVGKTTLYTFLHEDKALGGDLYQLTRHHLKYRRKSLAKPLKSQWEQRKGIDQRPECIHQEEHSGDFEINLIIGAKQQEAILTLTDRKTDYAIIEPLPKGGKLQIKTIQNLLNNRPRKKLNFQSPMELLDIYL